MRVIKWYSEAELKKDWLRIYIREQDKNYGPIFLPAKKIYTTRTASREASLPNLIEFLAESGDPDKAQIYYDVLGMESESLENKIRNSSQTTNLEVEEIIIGNQSTFFIKTFENLEFNIGKKMMINKDPIPTTEHYRNTFDDTINYELPEHWKPLIEKQRLIHQNLRHLGETIFFPFAVKRREAEEKYALRVIELQKEIETSIDWSLISIPGELRHEYAMNYTLLLFSQIKTGIIDDKLLPSTLSFSAKPWSDELKKINKENYRKIIDAKKLFRSYLEMLGENTDHDITIRPEPPYNNYWKKIEEYAEKNKITIEEAAIITSPPHLIQKYNDTLNIFSELKEEVKKFGGKASINTEMMRCKIYLNEEIESLKPSDIQIIKSKASIDTESVGYKGSKKEPEGKNPRTIVSTIVGDNFKKAYSYLVVPEILQSPYTNEVFKIENVNDYNLLLRKASNDYVDLSAVFGYNLESYDISAQSNSRRNTKKKDILYLDKKMQKIMEKPQNIFIPNIDNTEAEYKSATFLKHFTINTQIIDLLKIARNHYGLFTVNSKLVTFKNLIKHFNPELPFDFEKHAESYAEAERWFYDGRGEDLVLYGYTDTEATNHIAEYFWPVLEELEQNLKINTERLLRSKMDVATEYWAKKWYKKGIHRQVFETVSSTMFKTKINKNLLIKQEGLEPKLAGEFSGYAYINPHLYNSGKTIINAVPELKNLSDSMNKEQDFILKYLKFSFLESIIGCTLADMTLTRHGHIEAEHFKEIYKIEADKLFEDLENETAKTTELMSKHNYITFTGDMSFFPEKNEELEKNGFLYISPVKVLQKDKQDLAIKYIAKKTHYVGSVSIKLPSQREAYGEDYINKGFMPNFETKLLYEFAKSSEWQQRVRIAGEITKQIKNSQLNQKEYLMTIKPDHHLVNNALQFYDTKRGIIILKNGIRRDVEYTFIVEGYRNNNVVKENWLETDNLIFTEYMEKMKFYPHIPFYLALLWEPDRIFNKLFYNSLMPLFPEENKKEAINLLKDLEEGKYENMLLQKLELLKEPPKLMSENQLELF